MIRFCDDRSSAGFSWIVDEPATRTSHILAVAGRVWLVDPVDWPDAIDRACTLGAPAAVVQLLDRHHRDCAAIARRLGVPRLTVPTELPGTAFDVVSVTTARFWREIAIWWPEQRTLVVAEALGTNDFYTGGRSGAGVHMLLRPWPPRRQLGSFEPQHLLVGHGEGVHGDETTEVVRAALATSRTGLPRVVAKMPALAADARRRRRG